MSLRICPPSPGGPALEWSCGTSSPPERRASTTLTGENDMHIGLHMFATEYAIDAAELAREAERRGFESLFLPEHTHIPKSRRSPWPGGPNLPQEDWHTHDPFVALAMAASTTSTLKLGTGICLIIERDTIATAKCVASLDVLSGGRFLFGIGGGWNAEEMENHGTEFKSRFTKLGEQVRAMKEIWTKDEPEFHGSFVGFDPIWAWPKPAQKPHPPVLLGGESGHTLQRVVDFCDGWLPRGRGGFDIEPGLADLRTRADKAGRDMKTISVTVFGASADAAALDRYRALGITRVTFGLPSKDRDAVLPLLDRYAKLIH